MQQQLLRTTTGHSSSGISASALIDREAQFKLNLLWNTINSYYIHDRCVVGQEQAIFSGPKGRLGQPLSLDL
jgi:hypothetical protein